MGSLREAMCFSVHGVADVAVCNGQERERKRVACGAAVPDDVTRSPGRGVLVAYETAITLNQEITSNERWIRNTQLVQDGVLGVEGGCKSGIGLSVLLSD